MPDILGLGWFSFGPKSGSKSKIPGRILKSVRSLFSSAEVALCLSQVVVEIPAGTPQTPRPGSSPGGIGELGGGGSLAGARVVMPKCPGRRPTEELLHIDQAK